MRNLQLTHRRSFGGTAPCPEGQFSVAGFCFNNVGTWTVPTPVNPSAPTTPCPSGSLALPGGYCTPSIGNWTSTAPCASGYPIPGGLCSPVDPAVVPAVPSGQEQTLPAPVATEEPSWWAKQTDTTKALVIGGGAVAALGLLLLATSGRGKGPAIVYTSGQPMKTNSSGVGYFDTWGNKISASDAKSVIEKGSTVYQRYANGNWRRITSSGAKAWSVSRVPFETEAMKANKKLFTFSI